MREPEPHAPADTLEEAIGRIQGRVDAAAFALLREGRNPTVRLVRDRIPGGGSPNVVGPALQRWRLTLGRQLDENAGTASEVIPPPLLELLESLWARALFEAHRVRDDARSGADSLEQMNLTLVAVQTQMKRLEELERSLVIERRQLDLQRRRLRELEEERGRLEGEERRRPKLPKRVHLASKRTPSAPRRSAKKTTPRIARAVAKKKSRERKIIRRRPARKR